MELTNFVNLILIILSIGVTIGTHKAKMNFISREIREIKLNIYNLCSKLGEPYLSLHTDGEARPRHEDKTDTQS